MSDCLEFVPYVEGEIKTVAIKGLSGKVGCTTMDFSWLRAVNFGFRRILSSGIL